MRVRLRLIVYLFVLIASTADQRSLAAQPALTCPADPERLIRRSAAACAGLETGTACSGATGAGAVDFADVSQERLLEPGSRSGLSGVAVLSAAHASSIVVLRPADHSADAGQRGPLLVLVGPAELSNGVEPLPQISVTATSPLNVREAPHAQAAILVRLPIHISLTATGRSADSAWVRVEGSTVAPGWVSAELITAADDLSTLAIVDAAAETAPPFSHMRLTTTDAGCPQPAGLLIQTPTADSPRELTLNDRRISLAGTAWVTTAPEPMITVLEGRLVSADTIVPVGAALNLANTAASPVPAAIPSSLPVLAALERPVTLPPPADPDAIVSASLAPTAPAPIVPAITPATCTYTVTRRTAVFTRPDDQAAVSVHLDAGTVITPISQLTLETASWVRVPDGWLPLAALRADGVCLPLVESPYQPQPTTNALTLERCTADHGPIVPGQRVELSFTPQPFLDYPTALAAIRSTRGRLTINGVRIRTTVTTPIPVGDNRYSVRFSGWWTAQPGTIELIGTHAAYVAACTLTISPGN